MTAEVDASFMRRALDLARRGLGRTAPNPAVGCVLVAPNGQVVGQGWHHRAGLAHAEVEALRDAGPAAAGTTAYVTLEPCNHTGRTGPCTQALIQAGVVRVVVGAGDPNPQVNGSGVARLRDAGLSVDTGVEEAAAERVLAPFATWILTKRPLVVLKVATTLDGRIATSTGHSQWVTGPAARHDVHGLRNTHDAVMVGGGTLRVDNPALTTRLPDGSGRNAKRIVVTASADLPATAQLFTDGAASPLVLTGEASDASRRLSDIGNDVVCVGAGPDGVDLGAALDELGRRQITSVLVEAGSGLATSLLRDQLADRLIAYIAPKIVGGDGLGWAGPLGIRTMDRSLRLTDVSVRTVGDDVRIEGACVYGDR